MSQQDKQAKFLLAHLDSLPESHRFVAEFVASHWPLSRRLPRSVALQASRVLGFSVDSLDSSRRVLGALFLIASERYRFAERQQVANSPDKTAGRIRE